MNRSGLSADLPVLFPYYSRTIPVLFPYNSRTIKQTVSRL